MKAKYLIVLFALVLCSQLHGQDSLWFRMKIDENLFVNMPKKNEQLDTTLGDTHQTYRYRVLKAETKVAALAVTVTPNGTEINVDDVESLRSVLDSFQRGICKAFNKKGLMCKSKDSLLDGIPCKKIEAFVEGFKDPFVYNYCMLVNDKMYMFTITRLHLYDEEKKLIEESNRFLNSIRFPKTVKEKQFSTKAESTAYKFGYYLIPLLLFVGVIAFIVVKLIRS